MGGSRRVPQPLERLAAVLGLERLVADPPEEASEELAIERGVVDDEDPAGPDGAVARGRGHAGAPMNRITQVLQQGSGKAVTAVARSRPSRSRPGAPRGGSVC